MPEPPILSPRRLNRILLARQLLLSRRRMSVPAAIEHLVAMQSQSPRSAYVGLWTRVSGFRHEALEQLMLSREAVRIVLMRSTIHLVTARDCLPFRELVQSAVARTSRHTTLRRQAGVDDAQLADAGRELVDAEPRTFAELGELLQARWPACDPFALAMGVRELVPLAQVPPRGLWKSGGEARHVDAAVWLDGRPQRPATLETLVLRYLAAYGPATVPDVQTFTGLTGLRDVVAQIRPRLRIFVDDTGRELFDLQDAPLPTARTRAPVRFLPEFDNVLLSHADRRRILPDGTLSMLSLGNGLTPALLVDGFVAGAWKLVRARRAVTLQVRPFGPLPANARDEVEEEGRRLLAFAAPAAEQVSIDITR
jgi:hypothetical protein